MTAKSIHLFLVAALLVLPLDITFGNAGLVAVPCSILLVPFAIVCLLGLPFKETFKYLLAVTLSILSISIVSFEASAPSFRPVLSAMFFLLPLSSWFLAQRMVNNTSHQEDFVRYASRFGCGLAIAMMLSIVFQYDGVVRSSTSLNGDFIGISLVGSYGVHTLSSHLFLVTLIIVFRMISQQMGRVEQFVCLLSVILLLYIQISSLSREVVLAIVFTAAFWTIVTRGVFASAIVVSIVIGALYFGFDYLLEDSIWSTRLQQSFDATSVDELSSGRLGLWNLAFEQVLRRPFFGTGFYGFGLDYVYIEAFEAIEGWSTHIYYFTMLWKMGLIAFCITMWWFLSICLKTLSNFKFYSKSARAVLVGGLISYFLIVNFLWDAMLAPNNSMLVLFFLGSFCFTRPTKFSHSATHNIFPRRTIPTGGMSRSIR